MKIALLCATQRGLRVLHKLAAIIQPHIELLVITFKEEPWEPPFFEEIRATAEKLGATFIETKQVGAPQLSTLWESVDLMLVVSWRFLIPASVYERIRLGVFVFHDSLLPAYRGFSPTVWAMINGETQTGVTLFKIAEQVDAGEILAQVSVTIEADETISTVMERVTLTYLKLLEENLPKLISGQVVYYPQDVTQATYTCKRLPEDNRIDWQRPSREIYNLIRAVTRPYTGAYTTLHGEKLIIWRAALITDFPRYVGRVTGRVVEVKKGVGSVILTGDGGLLVQEVQLGQNPSKGADEVLNSLSLTLGR